MNMLNKCLYKGVVWWWTGWGLLNKKREEDK